jgi:adenylate kinase
VSRAVAASEARPLDILLLGPQGSGKGTQAKLVQERFAIPHVATGDIFREAIEAQTEVGRRIEGIVARGELVGDDLTVSIIAERLSRPDAASGFVLDGFPRNREQAEALDAMLASIARELLLVVLLDLPDDVARERMLVRAQTEGRVDDTPDVIDRRLRIYHEETEPVVERYDGRRLVTVDASRSVSDVAATIDAAIERARRG